VHGQEIVAQASYDRTADDRAGRGLTVADSYQGRGLGTLLLKRLAEAANQDGVAVSRADVMAENNKMLDVFRESGFGITMEIRARQDPHPIPHVDDARGAGPLRGPRSESPR